VSSPLLSSKISSCVDCSMSLIGECLRCPSCHAQQVGNNAEVDEAARVRSASSIWHVLLAWCLLVELMIICGILMILAVRGCS
jgi:hypothetical protein